MNIENVASLGKITIALSNHDSLMHLAFFGVRIVLVAIFLIAGIPKLLNPQRTKESLVEFGAGPKLALIGSRILPMLELVCAIGLALSRTAFFGAILSFGLLVTFSASISYNLALGRKPECNCFGQLHSKTVGGSILLRNVVLMFLAAALIVREAQAHGWTASQVTAVIFALVVLVLLASITWLLIQTLQQQAQLMVSVKDLQESLEDASLRLPMQRHDVEPPGKGLPVGAPAPDFELENVEGNLVTLSSIRSSGKPVILFFLSTDCGPCAALVPSIERWQASYSSDFILSAIIKGHFHGSTSGIGKLGLERLLLEGDSKISERYYAKWTPAAIAITDEGRVASRVAFGPEEITRLVEQSSNPRQSSSDEQIQVGDKAPEFVLTDLSGNEFRLKDHRGDELLLLFWNVKCSVCDLFLPEVRDWETKRTNGVPKIIIVSSSSREEHKAISFTCPILIDNAGVTFKAYGVNGTPSAC